MEYRLLDSGGRLKLEDAGGVRIVRPAQNAVWKQSLPPKEWAAAAGSFSRDQGGSGKWSWREGSPPSPSWTLDCGILKMLVKPTAFGHLGFFPEQAANWTWLRDTVKSLGEKTPCLNMFAYSGGSSLAMAAGGGDVCHVDAAAGMNEWARENLKLNPQIKPGIRWITEDVFKFTAREIRRGRKYSGIVLDPPSFGRGSKGEVWKIEDDFIKMLELCRGLLDTDNPFFLLASSHSTGFSPLSMGRCVASVFGAEGVVSGEMTVPEAGGRAYPGGFFARVLRR
jgi:23S rRNA (cytosine1962-C5)-methyltransferase